MLKFAMLGSLNYQPMSGYDLKQFTDRSTSNFWHAELSQIYLTLKTLEKEGLITSASVAQSSRPDRRVYSITPAGQEALTNWLREPLTSIDQYKDTLLLKLFFSARVGRENLLTQLRIQRGLHQKLVDTYKNETNDLIAQTIEKVPQLRPDALLWDATRRFGEMTEDTYLRWLDETIQMVENNF
jgi:PadR family transcriptional regulator AphA